MLFENTCEQLSVLGQAMKGLIGKKVHPLKKKSKYRTKTLEEKSVSEKESHEDVLAKSGDQERRPDIGMEIELPLQEMEETLQEMER